VLQGERPMAADNKSLGKFILDGIPPAPRGVPQIEVTFDIDANGILNVTASDKATGRSQKITITASSGLSEQEIEKMKSEAEQFADEDKKRKDLIEAKNYADNAAYTAEKTLKDNGDKIPDDMKKQVEEKVAKLRGISTSEDIESIQKQTEELSQLIQQIGASMYQQGEGAQTEEAQGTADQSGSDDSGDDDVVDGEFKNV